MGIVKIADAEDIYHFQREVAAAPDDDALVAFFRAAEDGSETLDSKALSDRFAADLGPRLEDLVNRTLRLGGDVTRGVVWISFPMICAADGDGFVIAQLQAAFRRWQAAREAIWKTLNPQPSRELYLSREIFAAEAPQGSRARLLLDALLGPVVVNVSAAGPKLYWRHKRWPSVNWRRVAKRPSRTFPNDVVRLFTQSAEIENHVRQALGQRQALVDEADVQGYADFISEYLSSLTRRGTDLEWSGSRDVSGLNASHVTMLLGRRKLHPLELIHRMMESKDIIDQAATIIGAGSISSFSHVRGISAMLDAAIKRSGYEKGVVFELEALQLLEDSAVGRVVIQAPIDGRSGPDFVIVAFQSATLRQAKSYENYRDLIGMDGEFLRQFASDLRRLWRDNQAVWRSDGVPHIKMPNEKGEIVLLPVTDDYRFLVDESRLAREKLAQTGDPGVAEAAIIAEAKDALDGFCAKVTGCMNGTVADETAVRREILASSTVIEKPAAELASGATIGQVLTDKVRTLELAGETVPIQKVFALRIAIDPRTGAIDDDLVREILAMESPFQLSAQLIAPTSVIAGP